jgi:nitroreductase
MSDIFQTRYLDHQAKKKKQLAYSDGTVFYPEMENQARDVFERIIKFRRTQRTFTRDPVAKERLDFIFKAVAECPSSCNRQAISIRVIEKRDDKDLLSGLLVGGVGWCHRADKILLLFANPLAYKAEGEIKFMPYLDAGVVINQIYLASTVQNLGVAYINPNIREANKDYFNQRFNPDKLIFTGAMPIGYFEYKSHKTPKRDYKEVVLEVE